MIKLNTLSARVALAMLTIVAVGVFILGIVFLFTFDHMEHKLLEMLDSYALQILSENEHEGNLPDSSTLINGHTFARFTSADNVPKEFQKLDIGFHHDIKFNERSYHIAVKDSEEGKKYLLFDITEIETQEHILSTIIVIAIASVLIIALWITYWLSRKVIHPVREFAHQVGNLDPNQRNVRLAERYNDVEIGSIARSFDRYMERLDGFVEREQSFTTTASHELRTPLSIISTSVELMENNDRLSSNSKQYLAKIKKSASEMTNLISALLFLAREDVPKNYNLSEKTNIAQLACNIIEQYSYIEKDKDIKLSISTGQPFSVDASTSHVQIIISNILNNAIRYTQNGSIQINIDNNTLQVIDSGTGIDDAAIKHAFEFGFRGNTSTGYGFGLYICKRICDRYGWDISITRNPDIGSTATVNF